MKGRFAPTPSGRMHVGNVFAALLSYLSVKSKGGTWVLRIEDLDAERCPRECALGIEEDLRALGLDWDEGGVDAGEGMYCQSRRTRFYAEALARLEPLCYPCFCSRSDILDARAPHESDGRVVYRGTCRDLAPSQRPKDRPFSTRIRVPDREICFTDGICGAQSVNLASQCGDFIVRRKDGVFAYQLAVVVDDALMGITEVVRGRDLLLSAAQQIFLFEALGYEVPSFSHTPLIVGADGRRLAKREASCDIGELLKRFPAEEIIGRLAFATGLIPKAEPCLPKDLVGLYNEETVGRKPTVYNPFE